MTFYAVELLAPRRFENHALVGFMDEVSVGDYDTARELATQMTSSAYVGCGYRVVPLPLIAMEGKLMKPRGVF